MALVSTSRVAWPTAPGGSKPVIFPAVSSATAWLICALAAWGAAAKSASATVAAAAPSRAVNPGASGRPACTHTAAGARNVTAPSAVTSLTSAASPRSPSAASSSCAASSPSAALSRCRAPASSAAVWPRAPHSAIRSTLATLAGENTMSAACSVSTPYMSAPNASSAAAGTVTAGAGSSGIVAGTSASYPITPELRSHPGHAHRPGRAGPPRGRDRGRPGDRDPYRRAGR